MSGAAAGGSEPCEPPIIEERAGVHEYDHKRRGGSLIDMPPEPELQKRSGIQEVTPETLEYEQTCAGEDIAFFVEMALRRGGPALDLGCGTGRLSIPLAESGLDVLGLDIRADVAQAFQWKLHAYRPEIRRRIRLIRADMRRFSLKQRFACAVCSSNTLLLAGDERSIEETLSCAAAHLRSEGILIFDVASIDEEMIAALARYPAEEEPDATFESAGGRRLLRKHTIKLISAETDGGANRVAITYTYYDGGGAVFGRRTEELVLLAPEKMLSIVKSSGFNIRETFGWYDYRPFLENERKLLVVAEKREQLS